MKLLDDFKKTLNEVELVEFSKFEKKILPILEEYRKNCYGEIWTEFGDWLNKHTNVVEQNPKQFTPPKPVDIQQYGFSKDDFINKNVSEEKKIADTNIVSSVVKEVIKEYVKNKKEDNT